MYSFIIAMGLTNMLGGRWSDVWGGNFFMNPRMFWRAIMPGVLAGLAALEHFPRIGIESEWALYVWAVVTIGSLCWYPHNWSFEEISGVHDPAKYPSWLRRFAYWLVPINSTEAGSRLRGIILKGGRGMFDVVTFLLLLPLNTYAMAYWLATFLMGAIYWAVSRIVPGAQRDVLVAEDVYGMWRGFLIIHLLLTAELGQLAGWLF